MARDIGTVHIAIQLGIGMMQKKVDILYTINIHVAKGTKDLRNQ